MSGEKRVTIRSSEYDRLRLAETQLRTIQADLPEVLNELRRESAAELQRQLEPLNRRQQAFTQEIGTMREELTARAADEQRKVDLAQAWLEAAEALGAFIDTHYPHQQFAPDQLPSLARE